GGALASVAAGLRGHLKPATTAAFLAAVVYGFFMKRVRRAHFCWDANAASLLGLPLFAYLLWRSRVSYKRGSVSWKGRTYEGSSSGQRRVVRENHEGNAAPETPAEQDLEKVSGPR